MTFAKGGKATITVINRPKETTYKLVGPGQIDLGWPGTDKLRPGIYKFDGDNKLTIYVGIEGKRPTGKSDAKEWYILQRDQPGEEKTPKQVSQKRDADKLRDIGWAMHKYHLAHDALPLHAIYDKAGTTPLLSCA